MKKAIIIWKGRIAPVFDEASEALIVDKDYSEKEKISLPDSVLEKIQVLLDKEVDLIICGAISLEAENAVLEQGLEISPFISGTIDEVISALQNGSLFTKKYAMPGCPVPFIRRGRGPCSAGLGRNFGQGRGMGAGFGQGRGLGAGFGQGRGLGAGFGQGRGLDMNQVSYRLKIEEGENMIIAISSKGKDLSSSLDMRFGRAAYFIIYNTEDKNFSVVDNVQNLNAAQGAGIQSAEHIVDSRAQVLITGNTGPKAFRVLQAAGVSVFLSGEVSVQDAINNFLDNKLEEISQANVEGHW